MNWRFLTRWWSDTLFKRLFALMWVALVVSHVMAFLAVTTLGDGPAGGGVPGQPRMGPSRLPTFPSLPPMSAPQVPREGSPDDHGGGPPGAWPGPGPYPDPDPSHALDRAISRMDARTPNSGSVTRLMLLDYGVRLLFIGLAAWFGARWLAKPMGRLASASRSLGQSLSRNATPARLDDSIGTVEVRDTARVFNEMAEQLTRHVQARSLLVAAISHDLRTPLTRIRLRLENVRDDPSSAGAIADRSIADVAEMDDMIESALNVFRGPEHEDPMQLTDVLALAQSLTDDLEELGQPVRFSGTDVARALVQPAALRRVLSNLINNALRYGDRAEVSVRVMPKGAPTTVEISIDDFGPGIPESQLEAVQQPFFRLETSRNRSTGGSGLGLYIARDLVTRQGGSLRLANRPKGGLSATVVLPLEGA